MSARAMAPGLAALLLLLTVSFGGAACGGSAEEQEPAAMLQESWKAYVAHFIQSDGRVIDHSAKGISTSEGQSYAMLRAVWIDDKDVFDKTHRWAIDNLNSGVREDALWAWKWGRSEEGEWRVLDPAFASDADQDAALALILAAQRWRQPAYLGAARAILRDLWRLGTKRVGGTVYLLAGDTLCEGEVCRINPSYYAPYAYPVFAQHDPAHPWMELVDSTYRLLDATIERTRTGLPPDWIDLGAATGELTLGDARQSNFSYDALRTFWRIALDYELNGEPRAQRYLERSLAWAIGEWRSKGSLPAVISASGEARAEYEAPEMLAALMAALKHVDPDAAEEMRERLNGMYRGGFWSERDRYYIQNWAWFGNAVYERRLEIFERAQPARQPRLAVRR